MLELFVMTEESSFPGTHQWQEMDTTVSRSGRIRDYWLGGQG
jgi:hypothetical protein